LIVDGIRKGNYKYLNSLDVSNNRICGAIGSSAIAQLLVHQTGEEGTGIRLETLNISQNLFEDKHSIKIFQALLDPLCYLKNIVMSKIGITMITGVTVTTSNEEALEKSRLRSIVLNENLMRSMSVARLSSFLGVSYNLESISLRSCSLEDQSLKLICERLVAIKNLKKLDCSDNRLTDACIIESLAPLIEGGMCPPFMQLNFSQNNITSKGA